MRIISIVHSYYVISHTQVAPTSCGSTGTIGNSASTGVWFSFSHTFSGMEMVNRWWKLVFFFFKKKTRIWCLTKNEFDNWYDLMFFYYFSKGFHIAMIRFYFKDIRNPQWWWKSVTPCWQCFDHCTTLLENCPWFVYTWILSIFTLHNE